MYSALTGFYTPFAKEAKALNLIERCFSEQEKVSGKDLTPYLKFCVAPVVSLIKQMKKNGLVYESPDSLHGYGLPKNDKEYLKDMDALSSIPAELSDKTFLDLLDSAKEKEVIQYLEKWNEKRALEKKPPVLFALYDVKAPPGIGAERRLTMMVSDGTGKDQWFATNPDGVVRLFSEILIRRGDPPLVDYRDHKRSLGKVEAIHHAQFGLLSCVGCHSSGLIVPHRLDPPKDQKDKARFEKLVQAALAYPIQKLGIGDVTPYDQFPGYGDSAEGISDCVKMRHGMEWYTQERNRNASSMVAKSDSVPSHDLNLKAIVAAVKCSNCHDGNIRNRLIPPLQPGGVLASFVKHGIMPGDGKLTPYESKILSECLEDQYFGDGMDPAIKTGILRDYLSKLACLGPPKQEPLQRNNKKVSAKPAHTMKMKPSLSGGTDSPSLRDR